MDVASSTRRVRGFVEVRGPDRLSGWAWRAGDRPLILCFTLDGELLGEVRADGLRRDLARQGFGDGRVAFDWKIPRREPPIEPADIQVTEKRSGAAVPDRPGLRPLSRLAIKGWVEARAAGVISGWATGPDGPLTLRFMRGRRKLGECVCDAPRPELAEAGLGDGRCGFRWTVPHDLEPLDPAQIRVVEPRTGVQLPDVPGLRPQRRRLLEGFVEVRGPDAIAGWAWAPYGPVRLMFVQSGRTLGELIADGARPELAAAGFGDGRAAFNWPIAPTDADADPAAIQVLEAGTGAELPDAAGMVVRARPEIFGFVEARGPEVIAGWAWSRAGTLDVAFRHRGRIVGRVRADRPRDGLVELGYGDGRAGFEWRLPFLDPPIDPAQVEVLVGAGRSALLDAGGLKAHPTARVRGVVETRGPETITGWAWSAGAPARLIFVLGGRRLGEVVADQPRPELRRLGIGSGRVGFSWRLPFLDPPVDPAAIEVRSADGPDVLADGAGVVAVAPPLVRGLVEARGPYGVSGWAKGPGGPVELEFLLDGAPIGRCVADVARRGLRQAGIGAAGFDWTIPLADEAIDPAAVQVRAVATGETIPDSGEVKILPPPPVRGAVDARGPEFIAGWARGRDGPVELVLSRGGAEIGRVRADQLRESLAGTAGFGDGRVGFAWRLPLTDPPFDPAGVEVRDAASGLALLDAEGLAPVVPPAVRGVVEARGADLITGWARGAGGPLRLSFELDGQVLGEVVADRPRPDLASVADGRAAFAWRLPFRDPPLDPARILVRDTASGALIPDAPGLRAAAPRAVRGLVEMRGPDVISGWAKGAAGPVRLRLMLRSKVLGEVVADGFRQGLLEEGIGDGRAAFEWPLPLTHPPVDPAMVRVVEAQGGESLPDAEGLTPVRPPPVRGVVEEASYRLVSGWAWDGRPGERLEVEIVQDGEVIGVCKADRRRADLVRSGLDDGRHGFAWIPPRRLRRFDADKVLVRAAGCGVVLPHRPHERASPGLEVSSLVCEAGWLLAGLRRKGRAAAPAALDLVCNGRFLLRADISDLAFDRAGRARLEIELPRQLFDGAPRRLTLHEAREGVLLDGQDEPLRLQSGFNSMIELLTPREIRGWVIDPDDPEGRGEVELRADGRLIRSVGYARQRPEVARAMGARRAYEFAIRQLPLDLFDGARHEFALSAGGRSLFPHGRRGLEVQWSEAEAAEGSERFEGAVNEVGPLSLKGFVYDRLSDRPVALEVVVDGEVARRAMADRYVAALKHTSGHGFHGFDIPLPAALMNGRRRRLEVRPQGAAYALPPGIARVSFPLIAVGAAPPVLAPPRLRGAIAPAAGPALLSLILLNLNGAHVLEPFLRSLEAVRFRDEIELILIDHGSTDESLTLIEAWRPRLRLIPVLRGENHSFSASNNLGAILAKGEHLVFVNNDIVFTGDALAGMRDVLDARPDVGLVGLRLLEPRYRGGGRWEEATHHTGVRFRPLVSQDAGRRRLYQPVEVEDGGAEGVVIEPAVTAALAMMRKADFRAIGGFDEAYHYGYEDVDLALRLRGRLGKTAVCRLDAAAVHNRSATREAKLPGADRAGSAALSRRDARANLDIFTRRFARHLPRLILRQLVAGGEAWRAAPLRVSLVVGEPDGREARAARALGEALARDFGWEAMLLAEDGHNLARTDVLVSLRPGYELRRIGDAAPGLITVAWPLSGRRAWEGREALYQLRLASPAAAARAAPALRQALLELLEGPCRRIALKAQAENEPHANALAQALRRRGHPVRLDGPRHWADGLGAGDEVVVAMGGMRGYDPFPGAVNLLCLAPGAEAPEGAQAIFDRVFEAGDPDTDAAAALQLHEALRREFLGALA